MFHLRRYKTWIAIIFTLCAHSAWAQKYRGNYNFLQADQKSHYFGIALGLNSSGYRPYRSRDFLLSDSIRSIESLNGPGLNIGIVTNLKIGDYFDFRAIPSFSFAERNINYAKTNKNPFPSTRKVESVFVEMPFLMRYKSAPYRDARFFVIAGVKYSFDVASDSRTKQAETLVKIAPTDFSFEYGAGLQIFLPFFIFTPEIKISQGIGNTLIFNPNLEESSVLEKVLSRAFTFTLHFEG
ncbi:MAG: hypothetical protein RL181_247 [Bacteroidota bacterium]